MFSRTSRVSTSKTAEKPRGRFLDFLGAKSKKSDFIPDSTHHKIHSRFGRKAEKPGTVVESSSDDRGEYISPTKRERIAEDGRPQQLVFTMGDKTFYADQSPQVHEPLVSRLRGQPTYSYTTPVTTFEFLEPRKTKSNSDKMPSALTAQRREFANAFNEAMGKIIAEYENTHIIGAQFHRMAGTYAFDQENIVIATKQANSAMLLLEDTLKALAKHYGISLSYWGEVKHFTELNLAESIKLYVSVETPSLEFTDDPLVLPSGASPYFTITFNALLNTRPVKDHEHVIFDALVSFIESEKQRLQDRDLIPFDFFASPSKSGLEPVPAPTRRPLKPLCLFPATSSSESSVAPKEDDLSCLSL